MKIQIITCFLFDSPVSCCKIYNFSTSHCNCIFCLVVFTIVMYLAVYHYLYVVCYTAIRKRTVFSTSLLSYIINKSNQYSDLDSRKKIVKSAVLNTWIFVSFCCCFLLFFQIEFPCSTKFTGNVLGII